MNLYYLDSVIVIGKKAIALKAKQKDAMNIK